MEKNEVTKLSNELTYRRYLMNRGKVRGLFREMTMPEYIVLYMIDTENENSQIYSGRTYLKDLSEKMQMPIRQISKLIGELKERGLVWWSHDGDGSDGTYVTVTGTGKKLLYDQEMILREYYGNVIEKFGKQNLIDLLQLMKQLETIMSCEIEEMETSEDE